MLDKTQLPPQPDLGTILGTRETRLADGRVISYGGTIYGMVDENGVLLEVPDRTVPDARMDAITEEMYVEHGGKRWGCVAMASREGRGPIGVQDRRDLQNTLRSMQGSGAVRES